MPNPEEIKQALTFMTTADNLKAQAEKYYCRARLILEGVYPPDSLNSAEQEKGMAAQVAKAVARRQAFRAKKQSA